MTGGGAGAGGKGGSWAAVVAGSDGAEVESGDLLVRRIPR